MEEPGGNETNTELHEAVFNNDLKTVSALLRSAGREISMLAAETCRAATLLSTWP